MWRNDRISTWAGAACLLTVALAALAYAATGQEEGVQIGIPVTSEAQIAAWNIDVRPDGTGAPEGHGLPSQGRAIFEFGPTELPLTREGRSGDPALVTTCAGGPSKCALCHGALGVGGEAPQLVGGRVSSTIPNCTPTPQDPCSPTKTVGSYWPYATTLFDYIRRAMPFDCPQSLTDDEVYAVTAYILFLNGIIPAEQEVNQDNLCELNACMPNNENFFQDAAPYLPKGPGPGGTGSQFAYPCVRRSAEPPTCLASAAENKRKSDSGER